MRKKLKITVIILIQLVICYFICEFSCFCFQLYNTYPVWGENKSYKEYFFDKIGLFFEKKISFDEFYDSLTFRPISGEKYNNKKSIILFGCSYVYGTILKDKQIFSYKLSEFAKKKVYNRAQSCWGPQNMLYQLRRDDFYNIIKEEPEIIIYTFVETHLFRCFSESLGFERQIFYKNTRQNELKESYFMQGKFPLYGYFAKYIRHVIAQEKLNNEQESYKLMLKHFEESKKEIEKHWKNTKFVIFVYSADYRERKFLDKMRKEKGFDVIFLDELSNIDFHTVEYQLSEYDMHPNEKAWNKIVPLLVKKLGIK